MKVKHKHTALNGKKKFISFASPKSQEWFFFFLNYKVVQIYLDIMLIFSFTIK